MSRVRSYEEKRQVLLDAFEVSLLTRSQARAALRKLAANKNPTPHAHGRIGRRDAVVAKHSWETISTGMGASDDQPDAGARRPTRTGEAARS